MQILASALPGFRDLRAPLTAGYMWLFFIWLVVEPDLERRPTEAAAASVYDLAQEVGPIWTAIAIGVVAYLLGSISQDISRAIRGLTVRFGPWKVFSTGFFQQINDRLANSVEEGDRQIEAAARNGLNAGAVEQLGILLASQTEDARFEAARELDLPATLLVGDQKDLFAEVDRLRAEGDLRLAVIPPLLAIVCLLASGATWWLLGLPAILLLLFQGIRKDLDSKKIIADATQIGLIKSSSIAKFSQWVEERLPAEIGELEKSHPVAQGSDL